jgi:hypothetical protein
MIDHSVHSAPRDKAFTKKATMTIISSNYDDHYDDLHSYEHSSMEVRHTAIILSIPKSYKYTLNSHLKSIITSQEPQLQINTSNTQHPISTSSFSLQPKIFNMFSKTIIAVTFTALFATSAIGAVIAPAPAGRGILIAANPGSHPFLRSFPTIDLQSD